jgi:CBS domain-containing protein
MRVSDVMSRNVVTIEAGDSCHEAVGRMYRFKVRHLPVLGADGRLAGIVTDRDLRHYLFTPEVFRRIGEISVETLLKAVPVSEVMSAPVITMPPIADLETAARVMLEGKVGSVPVVDAGRVIGILTETDMLREVVRADAWSGPDIGQIIVSFP